MNTKEQLFAAWRAWDLELSSADAKQAKKAAVDDAIDAYKEENQDGSARWAVMFYLRDEFAEWCIANP